MKKKVIVAAMLIAVVGVIYAVLSFLMRDIPAPDMSDLKVDPHELLPDDNAYTAFLAATNVLYWPADSDAVADFFDGNSVASNTVSDIITENEASLALIREGNARQWCIAPEVTSFETPLSYLSAWRIMGTLLAAKTRYDRLCERHVDATDACISLLRFADLIQRDAESIIGYLVGIAVLEMGLTQAQDIARDAGTPSAELARLSAHLADMGPLTDGLVRAVKVEYRVVANTIDSLAGGNLGLDDLIGGGGGGSSILKGKRIPSYSFSPNKTKLVFADVYRNMITNASLHYADMSFVDVDAIVGTGQNQIKRMLSPNAVGSILSALMIPALDSLLERGCRVQCEVAATQLLLSIHRYKRDAGVYPPALQDLIPKYIKAIPVDAYDGRPFRYRPESGCLYSVGKDCEDSGGSTVVPGDRTGASTSRWTTQDAVFDIDANAESLK